MKLEEIAGKLYALSRIESITCSMCMAVGAAECVECEYPESCMRTRDRLEEMADAAGDAAKRLMPEGVEWPCYEDGGPVMFGDCVESRHGTCTVKSVRFYSAGGVTVYGEDGNAQLVVVTETVLHEPVRKARPKTLAADGEPLEVGQTVWVAENGNRFHVVRLCDDGLVQGTLNGDLMKYLKPEQLTHQRPVLDADGVPIKVGDTVYDTEDGSECEVCEVWPRLIVDYRRTGKATEFASSLLTHQRPVLDADGVPIKVGDSVWYSYEGAGEDELTVSGFFEGRVVVYDAKGLRGYPFPYDLTHAKPEPTDTWERIEDDATLSPREYYARYVGHDVGLKDDEEVNGAFGNSLVRRCRALAEKEDWK